MITLSVRNPSPYPRAGHVTVPWSGIVAGLAAASRVPPAGPVVVRCGSEVLPAQLDRIPCLGGSRDTLAFTLRSAVEPGAEDYTQVCGYVTVEEAAGVEAGAASVEQDARQGVEGASEAEEDAPAAVAEGRPGGDYPEPADDGPSVEVMTGADAAPVAVRLSNERLQIWFDLGAHDGRTWFAGAASSVVLDGIEALDTFQGLLGPNNHDPEKRCMQIDHIRVQRPAWEMEPTLAVALHSAPYELLAASQGPVRATATVASSPFDYSYFDPFAHAPRTLRCRLYRTLSLFDGADYVLEEMWLRGVPTGAGDEGAGDEGRDLMFVPRYFTYMDLGRLSGITRVENLPNWVALGFPYQPYQGYGFATDGRAGPVSAPHPGYPDPSREDHTFSWELGPAGSCRCLHLFKRCLPGELADQTGHAWYELIFKPLLATPS